ncbi:hypothetical protein QEH59_07515 [Coraliomargarita sp. SDUM461004]|uniref:Uncharacterized protein n=1 Tax=Thalassobacterium sedimentorum TaxID=3041258 RepID=A0ABU1AJD0_9BACT|nr:hypothetical protein [Coraliomargarita sp. SDUM461004]MDQ8194268.1 hypothetical protein [Coraliomargarita sp. SDUM461004]
MNTLYCIQEKLHRALGLWIVLGGGIILSGLSLGCVSVKTEHRVEPIQITMDVNVRLERELEKSFAELDALSREIAADHIEEGAE